MACLYIFLQKTPLIRNDFVSLLFNIEKKNYGEKTVIDIIRDITRSSATS